MFIDPYIPTGYEPGLNALPIRYPSIIAPAVPTTLSLASASHPCTLDFKPQQTSRQHHDRLHHVHLQAWLDTHPQRKKLPLMEEQYYEPPRNGRLP